MKRLLAPNGLASPNQDPCFTLYCVRACCPDGAPIHEEELRSLMPEIDRVIAEVARTNRRRYEDDQEAGLASAA